MKQVLLIIIFSISLIGANILADETPWKTARYEYEGFPLLLRLPDGLKYDELKETYPQYISVTHILSSVTNDGLPEKHYNRSLFDFDERVMSALEENGAGITVLVETFGGKRTYYMYSKVDFSTELLVTQLNKEFPEHIIEIDSKNDKEWSFIKQYANDWKL